MSAQIEIWPTPQTLVGKQDIYENVVGHALLAVVKNKDGGLTVERVVGVNADSAEDNQIVGDFIKQVESKLAELFPEEEESKIWIPE